MTLKTQKIIIGFLTAIAWFGSLEALVYIVNLNQVNVYVGTSVAIYIYLLIKVLFLYDLHYKPLHPLASAHSHQPTMMDVWYGAAKIYWKAVLYRTEHIWRLKQFALCLNYLLLPTLIFWSAVMAIYLHLGDIRIQQFIALTAATALVICYWYTKEIFFQQKEKVDSNIFVILTTVKIYTAALAYTASFHFMRSNCLRYLYFAVIVFAITFLLIYQALFQHRLVTNKNLFFVLLISSAQGFLAALAYNYWGLNIYTAGLALTVSYNLFWGVFHYHLDQALTKKAFFEILIISLLIGSILIGSTNFKERLLDACI